MSPEREVSRRVVAVGLVTVVAGIAAPAWAEPGTPTPLAALERRAGGRLGVFALDLATGRTLAHRPDERFKLMSSFKGLLTAMVLHEVAAGRERLDALVHFGPADLMGASPITTANVIAGAMSVGSLCAAAMERSDNAAANLLMRRLGGPTALTGFLRETGDQVTQVDNYEGPLLASAPMPADSTTPRAITATLRGILLGPILPPEKRRHWRHGWQVTPWVSRACALLSPLIGKAAIGQARQTASATTMHLPAAPVARRC